MSKPKWKPRGSSMGYYMECSMRAAFDRALYEGTLDVEGAQEAEIKEAQASSPYADLGTIEHYHLQKGLKAEFMSGDESPTDAQLMNAVSLFNNDVRKLELGVRATTVLAARHMPPLPEGVHWLAEVPVVTPNHTGHIDFLSSDGKIMVDLKTTSRPPQGGRMKKAHKVQCLTYAHSIPLTPKLKKRFPEPPGIVIILYVDSLNAQWACAPRFDPCSVGNFEYWQQVESRAKMLRSNALWTHACPSIGAVCSEWCPYTSICRDVYAEDDEAGEIFHATQAAATAQAKCPFEEK